jgi:hypothetical protein
MVVVGVIVDDESAVAVAAAANSLDHANRRTTRHVRNEGCLPKNMVFIAIVIF